MTGTSTRTKVLRLATSLIASALVAAALTACTGPKSSSSSSSGDSTDATLTVSFIGPPLAGLNPAKTGGAHSSIFNFPAYDSLIWQAPDGSLKPFLALSWTYVDSAHKILELKLRKGVKFSDGTPFTAEAVKKYLEYYTGAGGHLAPGLADLDHVEVVDDSTVRIHMTRANPELPLLLTQAYGAGTIVSPKALQDPKKLDNSTDGTGPYIYDPKQSVAGDHYTYVKNPKYWNPEAQKFSTVVVRVISDANSVLSAVRSGQVDVAVGNPDVANAAKKAGVTVLSSPGGMAGIFLADRAGALVKALGDVRVRQALNYAVDQDKLAKVLYPSGLGLAAHALVGKADPGYTRKAAETYPYDPAKAKKLLTEAGYPDGFTLPITCAKQMSGYCQMAEAVASQLSKVGVTVKIDSISDTPSFNEKLIGKKAPAFTRSVHRSTYTNINDVLNGQTNNPFRSSDPQLTQWFNEVGSASPAEQTKLYEKIVQRLRDLAWLIPVASGDSVYFVGDKVTGVKITDATNVWAPFSPVASKAWAPAT